MRSPVLISLCLSLAITSLYANSEEFSKSRDLPPLKLSAADLDTILHKTQARIAEANGSSTEQESAPESVKLEVRGHEIEIPHFSLASSVAFPKQVFKFSYTYNQPGKRISSVTIDLGDYSRHVSVTGEAADQVEAISKLLENDLLRHSTAIGGAPFRHLVGMCLSVGLLTSLGLSGAYWWRTRVGSALSMLICSAVGLLLVFLPPWNRYFRALLFTRAIRPSFLSDMRLRFFSSSLSRLSSEFHYRIFFCEGKSNRSSTPWYAALLP